MINIDNETKHSEISRVAFPLSRSYRSNSELESMIKELINVHGYDDKSHVVRSAVIVLHKIREEMALRKERSITGFLSKLFKKVDKFI